MPVHSISVLPRCCPGSKASSQMGQRITKRIVDALRAGASEFTIWDDTEPGFAVRVRPSGAMPYVATYRGGPGGGGPVRRFRIAAVGKIAPEDPRARAKLI